MSSYSTLHLIAREILDSVIVVDAEIDKHQTVTAMIWVDKSPQHKVVLTLDWPNWLTIRDKIDTCFQDFDYAKKKQIGRISL